MVGFLRSPFNLCSESGAKKIPFISFPTLPARARARDEPCIYSGSCDLELMGFSNFCSDLGQQWTHVELEEQKDGAVYGGLLVLAVLNFNRQHALGHW